MELCPCGSQQSYDLCCEPIITFKNKATTAEQLMRGRYTAYVKGAVDFIHPPREIARELIRISKESPKVFSNMEKAGEHFAGTEQAQHNLFSIIRNSTHVDFSIYKPAMVNRRIARRMLLKRIDTPRRV